MALDISQLTESTPSPFSYTDSKDVPWYSKDLGDKLNPAARELLEKYSKVPADEVESHIAKVRDDAWSVWPYPCLGGFRFLDLSIRNYPNYSTILERLKSKNETFLDLGCCFGQEIRKLAFDGVPSEQLYGSDLRPEFFELGYKLFRDKETLKTKFIAANIFDEKSGLDELDGKIDIVFVGAFLHLFNYEEQVKVCQRIVRILKPEKDSLILGRQVGNVNPGEKEGRTGHSVYRHNVESFQKMWDEVGELTGTKWRVEATLSAPDNIDEGLMAKLHDSSMRRLRFLVYRE
ncbi:hypothetical protein F5884DRAFT_855054 [Xylogone sp. PMI_703]|nr:hypothetical protein F5884DRAFT_855054 [Xylogone sp. PMI_703]